MALLMTVFIFQPRKSSHFRSKFAIKVDFFRPACHTLFKFTHRPIDLRPPELDSKGLHACNSLLVRRVPRVTAQLAKEISQMAIRHEGSGPTIQLATGESLELSWQEKALCAETDPEAFFPEKGGSTREAKRVCNACDVRAECLEYALAHDERFGIWGGLSERERRRLKRRPA